MWLALLLRPDASMVVEVMAVTAVGALVQAVTGFGFSLVCVPILVLVVGPASAVRLVNELALVLNLTILAREHRHVQVGDAGRLLLPALVVTPLAAYAVHRSDPALLSVVVGVVIMASAVVLTLGLRAPGLRHRRGIVIAGSTSALLNTTSGTGGAAVAMFAVNAGWSIEATRPTLQLYFLGLNAMSIAALGPLTVRPGPATGILTAMGVGLAVGVGAGRRISATAVGHCVAGLALGGGALAVIRGLSAG
ncbi:MAG: sulfite exporter TauE/SafE family protein [Acidimicrobiales bacterium]